MVELVCKELVEDEVEEMEAQGIMEDDDGTSPVSQPEPMISPVPVPHVRSPHQVR